MKKVVDNETGEIIEVEEPNEIALRETNELINYEELYNLYEQMQSIKFQISQIEEKNKPEIMNYLKSHNLKNIKHNDLTISLRKGYMSTRFDTKKFKEEHEDLYNKYSYMNGIPETIVVEFGGKD